MNKEESLMLLKSISQFLRFAMVFCVGLGPAAWGQTDLAQVAAPVEPRSAPADIIIHVNQVAFDAAAPKSAVVETATKQPADGRFFVKDALTGRNVFTGKLGEAKECAAWFP